MSESSTSDLPRVLVVDDDPVCRFFCQQALLSRNCEVFAAASANAAIALACSVRPALIILDLHLEDDRGHAVPEAIRHEWPQHLPAPVFIAATGDSNPFIQASHETWGFAEILQKPFAARDLLKLAGRLLPGLEQVSIVGAGYPAAVAQTLDQALRKEWRPGLEELDGHVAALEWNRARAILHRLRGAAALAGHVELAESARRLDHAMAGAPAGTDLVEAYLGFLELGAVFAQRASQEPLTFTPHGSTAPSP